MAWRLLLLSWMSIGLWASVTTAQQPAIPHAQDKPPNEPRDPQTAAKLMTVPKGFVVEVVASEPEIVNPVAMAIDEKGRFWITESLEYPRREPGPGRDRVKLVEDTDADGVADKFSVFLDGLNIPSGVQVGHGGVWIANAPDLLFVPDKDRDGKADGPAEVVVTGFGRTDTHELPNSLTWGPDGWLYGLNGVFNFSHVKYSKSNPNYEKVGGDKHPGWPITCALFRIHPRTREFQVFSEGTSNPWGVAFNGEGDAFISACVIDHLWHLVETGYYHRQGGPYPPHTWKIESIVKHKHQKAAYCGITWFDSDAYPEQYRKKLYMGNIHGGCINVDKLERSGSTYAGTGEPDFLTANDAWFMPVVQKTGPDGSLYVLDWYDRYHCYQDANRDPAGIDRLKGRLYRVRYVGDAEPTGAPRWGLPLDLAAAPDLDLIKSLGHPNGWMRETAQRILQERTDPAITNRLQEFALDAQLPLTLRMNALFAVMGRDFLTMENWGQLEFAEKLQEDLDPTIRSWGVRLLTNQGLTQLQRPGSVDTMDSDMGELVQQALVDPDPRVRLQGLIYVTQLSRERASSTVFDEALLKSLALCGSDPLLQRAAWQTVKAYGTRFPRFITALLADETLQRSEIGQAMTPRIVDWLLAQPVQHQRALLDTLQKAVQAEQTNTAALILTQLTAKVQSGEIKGDALDRLKDDLRPIVEPILKRGTQHPLQLELAMLRLSWKDLTGGGSACQIAFDPAQPAPRRLAAFQAAVSAQHPCAVHTARLMIDRSGDEPPGFLIDVLATMGRLEAASVGQAVVERYAKLAPELQPRAIELVTQRPEWAKALLTAIGKKEIAATAININQARRLYDTKDAEVRDLLARHWGQVREGRSPDRDKIVSEMRTHIRQTKGDEARGAAVFKKVCAQCHKLYGEGAEVGPDITLNGRNDYTQLLSNIFDPSLVIGAGYRSFTVVTNGGRVINGLLVEDSPQRVVLKVQGGKQEIIARDDIDEMKVSEISLMPEALEKQLTPAEIADLFAYITLDKPPGDPAAKRLPGVYDVAPRASLNPAEFAGIMQEVAPGITQVTSGEGGVALLGEHFGRPGVVRTHPVSRDTPASLSGKFAIPAGKKSKLVIDVSHDPRGDWRLVVTAGNSGRLIDEMISKTTCKDGWATFTVDLTRYAGQEIPIRLVNQANDWAYEFGYWGSVRIVSE